MVVRKEKLSGCFLGGTANLSCVVQRCAHSLGDGGCMAAQLWYGNAFPQGGFELWTQAPQTISGSALGADRGVGVGREI